MQKISTITLFVVLLLVSYSAFSQNFTGTKLELFANKPDVFVDDLATDSRGFIWFLSKGKLYRYNGSKSLDIMETLPADIRPREVFSHILIDSDNKLWLSSSANLYFLDLKTWEFQKYPKVKLPTEPNLAILDMKLSPRGQIFIWYSNGCFVIIENDRTVLLSNSYLIESQVSTSIESFDFWRDCAWLGSNSGELFSISLKPNHKITRHNLALPTPISAMIPQDDFLILNLWYSGFIQVDFKAPKVLVTKPTAYHNTTMTCAKIWQYLVNRADEAENKERKYGWQERNVFLEKFFEANHIVDVTAVEVHYNNLFLATSSGVWFLYEKTEGVSSIIPQNTVNKSVRDIYQFQDGSIFFCSYGGAEYIHRDGSITHFNLFRAGYNFLPLDSNRILISTEGGLARIFDKRKIEIENLTFRLPDSLKLANVAIPLYVYSLAQDETYIYFGCFLNSLWKLNKKTSVFQPAIKKGRFTSNFTINHITVQKKGLLLSTVRGLMRFKGGEIKKVFPKTGNMHIYEHVVVNDTIWLATRGSGIIAIDFEGNELITINQDNGLSANTVYSLNFVNGYLIAGTGNGLSLIKNGSIRRLGVKEGIIDREFNHSSSFYSEANKKFYIGGLKGYTVLDMTKNWLKENENAKNYITHINVVNPTKNYQADYYTFPYSHTPKLELESGQNVVKISVGNPQSFKSNLRLEYKISGLVDTWQPMPRGNELTLMGMPVGMHKLFIRSSNLTEAGIIQLSLSQRPTFIQTWLFKVLLFSLLPLLMWIWYRIRLNKIKKDQALRTQIASDLHDEVGGLLTGISMQAEYLSLRKGENSEKSFLRKIVSSSNEAVQAMGEIVWSIDSRNDTWENFLAKLREYSRSLYETSPTHLSFRTEGEPSDTLRQKERVALYRIFKEALNNSCKHAKAHNVVIRIQFLQGQVRMQIEDDGVGNTELNKVNSGQGIKNMRDRAEHIHADFKLFSSESGVTVVVLTKRKLKSHPFG